MNNIKHDYRSRFSQSRSTVGWSLRLGWAYHKAHWQGCWPDTACIWTRQRVQELQRRQNK